MAETPTYGQRESECYALWLISLKSESYVRYLRSAGHSSYMCESCCMLLPMLLHAVKTTGYAVTFASTCTYICSHVASETVSRTSVRHRFRLCYRAQLPALSR